MAARTQFMFLGVCYLGLLSALATPAPTFSQTPGSSASSSATDLNSMNLEDLMNVQVSTVSKKQQKISQVAAAVFVITQEDIQRSGANNIPDLLRMVPGVQVAQINSSAWAISIRGLNDSFANELLVLVDGRSVYDPSFGGVFWDALDVPLEDIAQIEVIRGPGGSVWGANAVNGVINIVTKKARDTKGGLVVGGGGGVSREFSTLQYGGEVGKSLDYRVYTKYFNDESLEAQDGGPLGDGWHSLRSGFRADDTLSPHDNLTLQGDLYANREGLATYYLPSLFAPGPVPVQEQIDSTGGFVQGTWDHTFSDGSSTQWSVVYQNTSRKDSTGISLGVTRDTLDMEFQHNLSLGSRQSVVWGMNFLHTSYDARNSLFGSLSPASAAHNRYGGFVQDEITLFPKRAYFTVGTKLEDDYYSGFAALPSARLAWAPDQNNTIWAAVSRAVRTPGEFDTVLTSDVGAIPGPGNSLTLLRYVSNPHVLSEGALAYEAGYRAMVSRSFSIDLAAYFDRYDHQNTEDPAAPFFETTPAPGNLVLPIVENNFSYGESHGLEVFAEWRVTGHWVLSPGYAFEQIHMHLDPQSQDTGAVTHAEGASPTHSAQIRSHYALPRGFAWDVSAFYVDRLTNPAIPSYTRVDSQLSWQWREGVTLSVVGQNLIKDDHLEFTDDDGAYQSSEMQRSAYVKAVWRF
jgi:iron complex outermembrane recepter protein